MIRKSKNNEDKPDFEKMWGKVEENIQETYAEQDIISRVPELKELSGNIDKATNTCVNATLQCESVIRQYKVAEEKRGNAVDTISGKVDTINEHIDQVMEDAPTKLKVSANVSDADCRRCMNSITNGWNKRNRSSLTTSNYKEHFGRSKVADSLTLLRTTTVSGYPRRFSTSLALFSFCQSLLLFWR